MKRLKTYCSAVVLSMVLSLTALGGDMYGGIAPPPSGQVQAPADGASLSQPVSTDDPAESQDATATVYETLARVVSLVLAAF